VSDGSPTHLPGVARFRSTSHSAAMLPGTRSMRFCNTAGYLAASDLAPKTIQQHVDNLWVLGGEIIRDLNETPSLRKTRMDRLLSEAVSEDGGPLIHHGDSEEQQRSFDATCRKLRRFLAQPGH